MLNIYDIGSIAKNPLQNENCISENICWTCEAQYENRVGELVKKHFPSIPLDIQDHRDKDLYEKGV